jgi:hypothetical protein
MGCGCKNNKGGSKTIRAYKNKNRYTSKINFNKPTKTKEQLRQELIERMRRATKQ